MFKFDKIDLQRITVSTIGAAVLSVICVTGAVAPARADVVAAKVVQVVD
jgi:outer membrane murein-binding lipoprotein Lpp